MIRLSLSAFVGLFSALAWAGDLPSPPRLPPIAGSCVTTPRQSLRQLEPVALSNPEHPFAREVSFWLASRSGPEDLTHARFSATLRGDTTDGHDGV